MSGAVVWLAGGLSGRHNKHRVHCFAINCITVVKIASLSVAVSLRNVNFHFYNYYQVLQCVAMNVTLMYALMAYYIQYQAEGL